MELLIGCGSRWDKLLVPPARPDAWTGLVTLDINADHAPDVVHDLTVKPLPFADNTFAEVHAYEVLEHLGAQGDYRAWFDDFAELWRILKPGGHLVGTSPSWFSPWAWGDPGHTRIVSPQAMTFLDQSEYTAQVGVTPMTDYRFCYRADFRPVRLHVTETKFEFILEAVKPSRISS